MKRIKSSLGFFLSLIMFITTISIPSLSVSADNSKKIEVGDIITFGKYEQDGNLDNGPEDIEWQVLSVENDRIMALSKYGLDCVPYNPGYSNTSWETCYLRKWLNNDFFNTAFSSEEKDKIPTVSLSNKINLKYIVDGGNDTNDKVFCLSYDDTITYLGAESRVVSNCEFSQNLICSPTIYAQNKGATYVEITEDYYFDTLLYYGYYPDVIGNKACVWWLRTSASDDYLAWIVYRDGFVGKTMQQEGYWNEATVRPVIYIDNYAGEVRKSIVNPNKPVNSGGSEDLSVNYHTKTEIANYIKNHPVDNAYNVLYDSKPSTTYPYDLGKVSDRTLEDTCQLLNNYRYIAGIPANVTINEEYTELAQAACIVDAANNTLTHYPDCPSNMSEELYQKGYQGASSSNLGQGFRSLGNALVGGWMCDGDSKNIDRVGHRRWALNPYMQQTGFGFAGGFSAMYAIDKSNGYGNYYDVVIWPAQNTPIGYFNSRDPWSISLDRSISIEEATVTLTCVNTGQMWLFSGESNCEKEDDTGYFNINNEGYGYLRECIIFAPKNITISNGYSYNVSILVKGYENGKWKQKDGEREYTIDYTVDFFDIVDYTNRTELTQEQKNQVKEFVIRFYQTVLGRNEEDIAKDVNGVNNWTNDLIDGERTGCDVAKGFVMSPEFKNKNLNNDAFLKVMYKGFFNRDPDETGYNYWMMNLNNGVSREVVLAGFVNSPEFKNLCAEYGINPGELIVDPNKRENNGENDGNNQGNNQGNNSSNDVTKLNLDTTNVDPEKLDEYVKNLYIQILGREYDEGGLQYWKEQIMAGSTYDAATAARVGFFESEEYKNMNKTSEQFVTDCYHAFLGRDPEPEGLAYWMGKLDTGEYSKQKVIDLGFGHSNEFKGILTECGFRIIE